MVTVLGASTLAVGIIEGVAEATASITKVFSGALSDWLGKRKVLAALGYGLAAFTRPIFPLAPSIGWLVAARFIDRVGKGIRGAPRDALVADIAPPHLRGASFGLRQSLDTIGAFLGPLLAIGLMWLMADDFRAVFWIAAIPAFLSVGLILVAVKEPDRPKELRRVRMPLQRDELRHLGASYWWIVAVATVFTLARFSEAFLILRAQSIGLPLALVPIVLVIMSLAYSLSAYPVGVLSDRVNRLKLLAIGLLLLIVADLVLAFATGIVGVGNRRRLLGPAYGLHPRVARNLDRRRSAGRVARNCLRRIQSDDRCRTARRQSRCWRVVGHDRAARHVPGGCRVCLADPRRVACHSRSAGTAGRCVNTDSVSR